MKIIALMPIKNEAHILSFSLTNLSLVCDSIIVADQMSSDGSREIYKQFPKVTVIDNKRLGHSNEVRWDLLKEARKLGDNNLLLALDADEFINKELFLRFLKTEKLQIGTSFSFPWIQLWKNIFQYNNSKFFKNDYKTAVWIDDGKTEYSKNKVINDHGARIPEAFLKNCKKIDYAPIMHCQWLFWKKSHIKQVWYKCSELIAKKRGPRRINNAYASTIKSTDKTVLPIKPEWINGYEKQLNELTAKTNNTNRLQEIYEFFDKYGIEFFEPIEIWHLEELKNEFQKRTGRLPKTKKFPQCFVWLNNVRLKLKDKYFISR